MVFRFKEMAVLRQQTESGALDVKSRITLVIESRMLRIMCPLYASRIRAVERNFVVLLNKSVDIAVVGAI